MLSTPSALLLLVSALPAEIVLPTKTTKIAAKMPTTVFAALFRGAREERK